MPFTQTGIEYSVFALDYAESWTPQLVNQSFTCRVAWTEANQFLIDMLGDHQQVAGSIVRSLPTAHPFYPRLYCVGCELIDKQGILSDDPDVPGMPAWEYAVYRCTFANLNFEVLEDEVAAANPLGELVRYVERYPRPSGETVQMIGQFEFPDNYPLMTPPVKHLPYRELTYIWRYVPGPISALETTFDDLYGKVNVAEFDLLYAPETLLCLAPEVNRIPSTPGQNVLYDITYKFLYRPQTWNKVYRGTGVDEFEAVTNRATGDPPYASEDFDQLFTLG